MQLPEELVLSDSSFGTLGSCGRKFEFRKLYKAPRGFDDIPAMAGKALHVGYQSWLSHSDVDKAILDMMCAYNVCLIPKPHQADWSLEACYSTLMALIINANMSEYQLAKVLVDGEEKFGTEIPFKIRFTSNGKHFEIVPGTTVSYIGYLDALLYKTFEDDFFVADLKTHRRNLNDLTPLYRFSEQCIPYALVIEYALKRKINSLSIKYITAFVDVRSPRVVIYPFEKSYQDIQDWLKGVLIKLKNIKMYLDMEWFPRNGNSCLAYNRPCGFMEVCPSRDPKHIELNFAMQKGDLVYQEQVMGRTVALGEFKPWFVLDLEIGEFV